MRAAFVALVLAVAAAVTAGVGLAAQRAGLSGRRVAARVGGGLSAWLALVGVLAATGILVPAEGRAPLVLGLVWIFVALLVLAVRAGRGTMAAVPSSWIIGLQVFRVPVEIFLWRLCVAGLVPQRITFEGRNFDILVGVTAPVVAWLAASKRLGRMAEAVWHVAGLGLVLNVAVTAVLSVPGPLRVVRDRVPPVIVGQLPWVWLPTLLVPLAAASHVLCLARLRAALGRQASPFPG